MLLLFGSANSRPTNSRPANSSYQASENRFPGGATEQKGTTMPKTECDNCGGEYYWQWEEARTVINTDGRKAQLSTKSE